MSTQRDIRWSSHVSASSRRRLLLWTTAALVTMCAHAGAAWVALGFDPEPQAERVAGGAIEIDMAALGFAEADQLSAGNPSEAVEPTQAEAIEPVETALTVEHAERATTVDPDHAAVPAEEVQTHRETRPDLTPETPIAPVDRTEPVVHEVTRPIAETPPIESPQASEVQIAAASPVAPTEAERSEPLAEGAVPAPVDMIEPVEDQEVAALIHVPLPTPRPDYTPATIPRAEKPKVERQRQAEAPQQQKARTPPPPKKSGSGGQNQADARRGTADGSASSRAEVSGGSRSNQAGNADVSNYPGKVSSKLRRALRYPSAAKRDRLRGEVHVSFTVDSSGGVGSVRVARSSGSQVLDQAALETVRRAAPFPPIPVGAGRSNWPFTVPLSFTR